MASLNMEIEQDPHAVFLLHRPRGRPDGRRAWRQSQSYFAGEDKIIIAKQRSGPARDVHKGAL